MIQHMDNFTPYGIGGQARMLNGVFASIGNFSCVQILADPDPSAGGAPSLWLNNSNGQSSDTRLVLSGARTTVGMASRMWLSQLPLTVDQQPRPMFWRDGSNNTIISLLVTTTGSIQLQNAGGTVIAETAGPVVTANAWWHLEGKAVFAGAASTFELRVEGLTVLTVNPFTTASSCSQVASACSNIVSSGSATSMYLKDYVVWDSTGSYNTNFLGSVVVASLVPNSDVATGWTPSTGTLHYPLVDNSPPVDATDYVTAPFPLPGPDQYGLSNLPTDVTSVKGIMTFVRARKTDGGDGNLQVKMISGASTGNGVDRPITAAFSYWRDLFEVDPATTAPWIPGAVDASNVSITRTT